MAPPLPKRFYSLVHWGVESIDMLLMKIIFRHCGGLEKTQWSNTSIFAFGLMSQSEKFWPNSCFNNYLESGELLWNSVSLLICQSRMVDEKVIPILFYFSFNKLRWWDYHWQQHQTCQLYSSFHLITLTLVIWSTMLCILWLSTNSKSI